MSNINTPLCSSSRGNTGIPSCFFNPAEIRGVLLTKKTTYISSANMADDATLKAALQTATLASGDSRIYPIFRFQALTDNTEDIVIDTTGYGEKKVTREGDYDFTFEVASGGICLLKNLRKFNYQGGYGVYLVDGNNVIWGRQDSSGNLYPFDLGFWHALPIKVNDGSGATKELIRFTLPKKDQVNDDYGYYAAGFDVDNDVLGILDIQLTEVAVVAGKATISAQLDCGKTDLYTDLSTLLADKTLWTVETSAGVSVSITDVTANASSSAWDVEFTGTGAHTIGLASAATLAAAGVGGSPINGYEGIDVDVTMP